MSCRAALILSILNTLFILLGLYGCIAFFFCNIAASFWAFLTALLAAINLHLHLLYIRDKLDEWHSVETLEGLKLFGFFVLAIHIGVLSWFIFYIIYNDLSVLPVEKSMIIPAVWIFLTAKLSGCLYASSTYYIKVLNDNSRPLLSHR